MPSFDLDAARRERLAGLDPVDFTLGGVKFDCRRAIPFENLLRVVEDETEVTTGELFRFHCAFIADCLEDGQEAAWTSALTNQKEPVGELDVEPLVRSLVVVYAARPTSPSNGSSAGRATTGRRSKSTATGSSRAKKRAS